MGHAVEFTDTGVKLEVHRFDDHDKATHYVRGHRGYTFHKPIAGTEGTNVALIYRGPKAGERATVRPEKWRDGVATLWRVSFWSTKPQPEEP